MASQTQEVGSDAGAGAPRRVAARERRPPERLRDADYCAGGAGNSSGQKTVKSDGEAAAHAVTASPTRSSDNNTKVHLPACAQRPKRKCKVDEEKKQVVGPEKNPEKRTKANSKKHEREGVVDVDAGQLEAEEDTDKPDQAVKAMRKAEQENGDEEVEPEEEDDQEVDQEQKRSRRRRMRGRTTATTVSKARTRTSRRRRTRTRRTKIRTGSPRSRSRRSKLARNRWRRTAITSS